MSAPFYAILMGSTQICARSSRNHLLILHTSDKSYILLMNYEPCELIINMQILFLIF